MVPSRHPTVLTMFAGMNNVSLYSYTPNDKQETAFRVLHNLDITPNFSIKRRDGYVKKLHLPEAHSLFSVDNMLLCVAFLDAEALCLVDPSTWTYIPLAILSGKGNTLYYVRVAGTIYMSNRYWKGKLDLGTLQVLQWGWDSPEVNYDVPTSEHLMGIGVKSPPNLELIALCGGRIWGARGRYVYYSDPLAYDWFRDKNVLPFPDDITMIAPVVHPSDAVTQSKVGIYFATTTQTWFMKGHNPQDINLTLVGDGAIKDSLAFGEYSKIGQSIPMWLSKSGIQVGTSSGEIVSVTRTTLKMDVVPSEKACAGFRLLNGAPQYIVRHPRPVEVGMGDSVTVEVFRRGSLLPP